MMRETEFRALADEMSPYWVYGDLVYDNGIPRIKTGDEMLFKTCLKNTESQYIGRKDKNGKKIYNRDIVKVDDREIGDTKIRIGEIYCCLDYTLESNPCFAGWSKHGHFRLSPNIEVIGNIYENPELLK
jgi:uncharacterized phage protein (TIGR01671 family)